MSVRVASLIPSGTEIVSALGMADTLVGRSHCCDYPAEVLELPILSRPRVDPAAPGPAIDREVRQLIAGGASVYEILMDALLEAAPDVVITQDHCDACAVSLRDVEAAVACAELAGAKLCALHPHDLAAVRRDFHHVADSLGVPDRATRLEDRFQTTLDRVEAAGALASRPPRVLLLEWLDPPMVAGGWIPELARLAGLHPLIVEDSSSFQQVGWDDVLSAHAEAVVLLPCGFSVARTLTELRSGPARRGLGDLGSLPRGIWIVDGDAYFNRPGPRLAESAELLATIFHPGLIQATSAFEGDFVRLA